MAGLRATQYVVRNTQPRAGGKLSSVAQAECWVADDIVVPEAVSNLMSDTYDLPKTKLFPLKVAWRSSNGKTATELDTFRSQSSNIPANYFTAPAGYAQVKSQAEVFMDDETKQMFNDMAREAGLDVDKPRPQRTAPVANAGQKVRMPMRLRGQQPQPGNNEQTQQGGDQLSRLLDSFKGK